MKLNKAENFICDVLCAIIAIILLGLVGINVVQVATRYFISVTVTWVEDISILGILWIAAIGVPVAWFKGQHLIMDITDKFYASWLKEACWWILQIVGAISSYSLIDMGIYTMELNRGFIATAVGYDEALRYLPLAVCGVLLGLAVLFSIIEKIRSIKNKDISLDTSKEVQQ